MSNRVLGGSGVFARAARRATSRLWANRVLGGSAVFARATRRAPRDIPVMGEPGIGWIRGFCARRAPCAARHPGYEQPGIGRICGFFARRAPRAARRATSRLWTNGVLGGSAVFARAARRATSRLWANRLLGRSGVFARAARRATSRLWANRVLGGSAVFARAARRATSRLWANRVLGESAGFAHAARRATSWLWANRVVRGSAVFARAARRAPRDIPVMGEPGIGRIRGFCAHRAPRAARHPGYGRTGYWADPRFLRAPGAARRATSRLWANRVLGGSAVFARAACRAPRDIPVMGEPGIRRIRSFCARRAPRAARHPGYGRTGYSADPRLLRAPRAARHPGFGRTGYWADPRFLRAPPAARRATSRLWANRVLGGSAVFARAARCAPRDVPVMGEPGIGRIPGFCARRAPRDIPVMGEPGIGRIRGFGARRALRAARHPGYGRTGYWADPRFLHAPRAARRATSRLWANRVLGGSAVFVRTVRRAPRDIPVMGEPGIGRIRGFRARRAPRAARHPRYGRTGYWADPRFLRTPRAARRATSRL